MLYGDTLLKMPFILTAARRETYTPPPTVLKAFVVIKLLLSGGMPVSKFTLKYFNKTIANVYSLSKYSPKALLGQVLCQHQSPRHLLGVREPGPGGAPQSSQGRAQRPGAIQAVFA